MNIEPFELFKPNISIDKIDNLFYVVIALKYRHYKGFTTIEELYKSRDFLHYKYKFGFN